jgi:hypothetical protein
MKHTYGVTINPSNFPVKSSGSLSGQLSSNNKVPNSPVDTVEAVEMTTTKSSITNPACADDSATRLCRAASDAEPIRASEFEQNLTKAGKNTTASL